MLKLDFGRFVARSAKEHHNLPGCEVCTLCKQMMTRKAMMTGTILVSC
jgi:hypothetical protein